MTQFDSSKAFDYCIDISYADGTYEITRATSTPEEPVTLEDFREFFEDGSQRDFFLRIRYHVWKEQNGKVFPLTLKNDHPLVELVKEYNETLEPTRYVVIGFDWDERRHGWYGNYGMGDFGSLDEVHEFITRIQHERGEDAPLMEVERRDGIGYTNLDLLDEETVRSWRLYE